MSALSSVRSRCSHRNRSNSGPNSGHAARRRGKGGFKTRSISPVAAADALGLLGPDTLAVHVVCADAADRKRLAASGATVCLCPRSNEHIGVGRAPAMEFLRAGVNLCLGTDGLCSNADLDPYGEAAWLLEHQPELDLVDVLAMITTNPARFFGRTIPRAARLGSLEAGRLARFSVVPEKVLERTGH